ncbi:MAG: Uma2 family endonuclease [bacterium]
MTSPASARKKAATYADIEALPEHLVGELIDGELVVSPRPALRQARSASRLGMDLGGPFDRGVGGPGGWIILDEPELHLEANVLVPDLAGWRRERMPELPDTAGTSLAPDWICEVLSPSTEADDRAGKMPIYARFGVAHLWLLDPILETLEGFRLQEQGWFLVGTHRGERKVCVEPFDAVELDLGALWER